MSYYVYGKFLEEFSLAHHRSTARGLGLGSFVPSSLKLGCSVNQLL